MTYEVCGFDILNRISYVMVCKFAFSVTNFFTKCYIKTVILLKVMQPRMSVRSGSRSSFLLGDYSEFD